MKGRPATATSAAPLKLFVYNSNQERQSSENEKESRENGKESMSKTNTGIFSWKGLCLGVSGSMIAC